MLSVIITLLFAAPARPADTMTGGLCAYDAASGALTGADLYISYQGDKAWRIDGDRLTPIDPAKYVGARGKPFFINAEPVTLKGKTYIKYGLPRVLSASDLETKAYDLKDGAPFFLERGNKAAEVVYLLASGVNCEFQPYQIQR